MLIILFCIEQMNNSKDVNQNITAVFAEFYETYLPRVFNYIIYRVNDKYIAEDLTSIVFEKALTKFKSYKAEKISDTVLDQDMSASLDFMRKMISLRTSPSVEFKSQLKAKLLRKLIEEDENLIMQIEGTRYGGVTWEYYRWDDISGTYAAEPEIVVQKMSAVITLIYRYNETVIVPKAPLTPDGELLDGWHIYIKPEGN